MKVGFSPRSAQDLEEIGDFIARDSPRRAVSFVDELEQACEAIADAPLGHEAQPHLRPDLRRAVYGRYLIFYSVREAEVRIERVLHGARDLSGDLFQG